LSVAAGKLAMVKHQIRTTNISPCQSRAKRGRSCCAPLFSIPYGICVVKSGCLWGLPRSRTLTVALYELHLIHQIVMRFAHRATSTLARATPFLHTRDPGMATPAGWSPRLHSPSGHRRDL